VERERERIRQRRDALKLSQEELAAYAGVDQSQISRAESPKRPPVSRQMLDRILTALDALESSGGDAATAGTMGTAAKSNSSGTVLEMAIGRAFAHEKHLLRDAVAVQREFQHIALPQMTAQELQHLCGRWLDAAARLRTEGTPVTSEAISAVLSVDAMRSH